MLRSLSLPDLAQRTNVITSITSILETPDLSADNDELLHSHAEDLLNALLKSAHPDPEEATSGVRDLTATYPMLRRLGSP